MLGDSWRLECVKQFSLSVFLNFFRYKAVFIVKVIKCAKIILSDKVFSSIIVTIANVKGCVWMNNVLTTIGDALFLLFFDDDKIFVVFSGNRKYYSFKN